MNRIRCTLNSAAGAVRYLVQCLPRLCFCPCGPDTSVLTTQVSPEDRAQVAHHGSRAIGRGKEIAVVMIHLPSRLERNLPPGVDVPIESNSWVRVRASLDHYEPFCRPRMFNLTHYAQIGKVRLGPVRRRDRLRLPRQSWKAAVWKGPPPSFLPDETRSLPELIAVLHLASRQLRSRREDPERTLPTRWVPSRK